MFNLFKKSRIQKLKELNILPNQYSHDELSPVELTDDEELKFGYKKKSIGYFDDDSVYETIVLVDYNKKENRSLTLSTQLINKKEIKNNVNYYFEMLGTDEKGKEYFDRTDLDRFEKLDSNFPDFRIRNWEFQKKNINYMVDIYVTKYDDSFELEISVNHFKLKKNP